MVDPLPYSQWPDDTYNRQYQAERVFGRALLKTLAQQLFIHGKDYAALAPSALAAEVEALARKASLDGIYAVMMLLDGVASSPIDAQHGVEWALQARVEKYGSPTEGVEVPMETGGSVTLRPFRPAGTERIETIEVVPDGDGLCYAFHGWKEGRDDDNQP